MKARLLPNISTAILILLTGAACSSSGNREFKEALNQEQEVAKLFAGNIRPQLPENGQILVLVSPDIGPRLLEARNHRLQGFRQALGSERIQVVPITHAEDPRLMMVENDEVPVDLFLEAIKANPQAVAVISLIGFPHDQAAAPLPLPVYLYGISHQELAWQAMEQGWASAVLYYRGASDEPARSTSPISHELLASYIMETR